jgi:H+-translocating NAD(P) transhydrogenase subunit beta
LFPLIVGISLIFGVLLVIPIGGADMPTVISLLNGYAGLSAAAMGFVLHNKLLIIAGALDGSSGLILSVIMSKAMNRSFTNVLFGAFGQVQAAAAGGQEAAGAQRHRRGIGCDSVGREQSRHRPRLRHGRGAGAAQSARTV